MPSEKTLRQVKGDLTERFAHQQQIGGVSVPADQDHKALHGSVVPDVRAIDDYLDPILRKVDAEEEQAKATPVQDDVTEAVDYVEERTDKQTGDKYKVAVEHKGFYDWNLKTNGFVASPGSFIPPAKKKESVETIAARHRIRFLKALPEWNKKFVDEFFTAQTPESKEMKLREILDSSNRLFGDWRHPRNAVVSVFGKLGLE